ncbi:MAG: XTP/dITP diphosphatase [Acetivibrionales bacterium]|jgi:XTP/dITP diphosphohydrolase
MKKFVVATQNRGKIEEIKEILKGLALEVLSMGEVGINKEIQEDGKSFEENALIKAREVYRVSQEIVMGDDSGLEVDYLNGAPGIYSSRFAGEGATDRDRVNKLLDMMKGVPFEKRTARFVCAAAVVFPGGSFFTVRGTCEGYIALKAAGENGFGYDPVFFLPDYNMTIAQMEPEEKNRISHRGKALRLMLKELKKIDKEGINI